MDCQLTFRTVAGIFLPKNFSDLDQQEKQEKGVTRKNDLSCVLCVLLMMAPLVNNIQEFLTISAAGAKYLT